MDRTNPAFLTPLEFFVHFSRDLFSITNAVSFIQLGLICLFLETLVYVFWFILALYDYESIELLKLVWVNDDAS